MREYSEDECRNKLLDHIWNSIDYWRTIDTKQDRLEGLAFSILAALDGCAGDLPSFIVAPNPHPDDKEYHAKNGENWWPENHHLDTNCDLGGGLHDVFHSRWP